MKARRLAGALAVAILLSLLLTFWISRKLAHPTQASTQHQYAAAAQNFDAGQTLRAVDIKMINWPSDTPLEGASGKPEELVGRTLLYPAAAGQPILSRQLSAPGSDPGLSTRIPDGMRAISLKSDEVVGVAGYLLPGTHVDVLVTYHTPTSPDPVTSTVLQDARILTAGQKMQPDPEGKPTTVDVVTLLVTPDDAAKVVLASTQGTVHFVLRNGSDHTVVNDGPTQLSALGGIPAPKPVARPVAKAQMPRVTPAPQKYSVETRRGDKESVETF